MLDIRSDDRPVRDVQLDRAFFTRILTLRLRIGREEDCHKSVDLSKNAEYSDCDASADTDILTIDHGW